MSTADFINEDCALWEGIIKPTLGARECRQFVQATRRQDRIFLDRFLLPQMFRKDARRLCQLKWYRR